MYQPGHLKTEEKKTSHQEAKEIRERIIRDEDYFAVGLVGFIIILFSAIWIFCSYLAGSTIFTSVFPWWFYAFAITPPLCLFTFYIMTIGLPVIQEHHSFKKIALYTWEKTWPYLFVIALVAGPFLGLHILAYLFGS